MKRFLIAFAWVSTCAYGSAIVVTNPAMLNSGGDIINWAQMQYTGVNQSFSVATTFNETVRGTLSNDGNAANGHGAVVKACTGCAWAPTADISAYDALLVTGTAGGSSAPLTLNLNSAASGIGAFIDAGTINGPTGKQFTARIQAFSGVSSVLDSTVTSDLAGDAIFLGVLDTATEVTSVVYSLIDSNGKISTNQFILDKVYFQSAYAAPNTVTVPLTGLPVTITQGAAPEPGTLSLLSSALLGLAFLVRNRSARA